MNTAIQKPELQQLAVEINAEHAAVETMLRAGLAHALHCGELLIVAKKLVAHGQWLPWLVDNCTVSERTAQAYMRVASHRLELKEKSATVADFEDLSFRQGLLLLSESSSTPDVDQDELKRPTKVSLDKAFYRIADWEKLTEKEQQQILSKPAKTQFNAQENSSIEWARWSWNPVTGCLHNCPYCYARDIANRFYTQKFDPSLIPGTLKAPGATPMPSNSGVGYHNVFVCSMADLFGKWVPAAWIDAVLAEVYANPQWNFLFLTKFPQRMAEFEYPDNAWLGTTVDLQARVKNAERAMDKVRAKVRWLSVEPLLERVRIDWSLFDWIVLGGSSASTETPAWQPPRSWVWEITMEAQTAGCAVYHKDNLAPRLRDYPGDIEEERDHVPEQFQYLKVIA